MKDQYVSDVNDYRKYALLENRIGVCWSAFISIKAAGAIPGSTYFNNELSRPERLRIAYMAICRRAFMGADLVFFDFDNGIEPRGTGKGLSGSERYVFLDEKSFRSMGRARRC